MKKSPEKPETRIMWNVAKRRNGGFNHIRVCLSGKRDIAKCVLCEIEIALEVGGRTRQSVLLETARKHYYKHKLDIKNEI